MKSFRNILIAVVLGISLAGLSWNVAHAPKGESFVALPLATPAFIQEREEQANVVVTKTPSVSTSRDQPKNVVTMTPENLEEPFEITITTTPATITYSCLNGVVGGGVFVWPADNHFLSGKDYGSGHPGIDIAAGEGSPVYAADAGVVIAEGEDAEGYGKVIQIDHGNGYLTVYAHLRVIEVRICQSVDAGQRIGGAGSTGNAQGAHLHFEVARDGWHINPWDVLP